MQQDAGDLQLSPNQETRPGRGRLSVVPKPKWGGETAEGIAAHQHRVPSLPKPRFSPPFSAPSGLQGRMGTTTGYPPGIHRRVTHSAVPQLSVG
ncbi:unnamed protein product [Lota lota]